MRLVRIERQEQPYLGAVKLLKVIRPELENRGISIGRDRFFEVLREHELLIQRRRSRGPRTTESRHNHRVYNNLLGDKELTGPHQAWVSDITYIRVKNGFRYLSLVMDAHSRMIVGSHLHRTLEATGAIKAVRQAIRQLPPGSKPIHHSDRGIQYCCIDYIKSLEQVGITVSMTEENHCYENAMAERLNGILKYEYGLKDRFESQEQAITAVNQAVKLYNHRRPHRALGNDFPAVVHAERIVA